MASLPKLNQALRRRVSNPLPVPVSCNLCTSPVVLSTHKAIYGRDYSGWPYMYLCTGCGAYVGLHPKTDIPLGTLADRKLREARKRAKNPFELWRKEAGIKRGDAYRRLAAEMGIETKDCHFGWFDIESCDLAESAVRKIINEWMIKKWGMKK